jgi:acetoin utilization protein AcuB
MSKEDRMKVHDLMTPDPITISQDATLREALEIMEHRGCHHLPVVNQHGYVVGVITSHDCRLALNVPSLMRKHWQSNKMLDHMAVMTFMPIVVDEDAPADEAVTQMLNKQIGCLPVMCGKELVGIVTTTDILRAFIRLLKQMLLDEPSS